MCIEEKYNEQADILLSNKLSNTRPVTNLDVSTLTSQLSALEDDIRSMQHNYHAIHDPTQTGFRKRLREKEKLHSAMLNELVKIRREKFKEMRKSNKFTYSESEFVMQTNDEYNEVGHQTAETIVDNGGSDSRSLDSYFERPVYLGSLDVAVGTSPTAIFNVWSLWIANNAVRAKLRNYSYFKADLVVQVTLTSTKYHYGNFLLSYQPLHEYNEALKVYNTVTNHAPRTCYLSQSSDNAVLRAGQDNNVEMRIPMIYPIEYLPLTVFGSNTLPAASAFPEIDKLGVLYLSAINTLRCANDDFLSDINFQLKGWVENLELGPPTSFDLQIISESQDNPKPKRKNRKKVRMDPKGASTPNKPQNGIQKFTGGKDFEAFRGGIVNNPYVKEVGNFAGNYANDEYNDSGPVTKIASAVSNAANALSTVPVIGLVAKATSMATGVAASVANWFGFARPNNMEPLIAYKNQDFVNMANYTGKDTAVKLTGDPKQELCLTTLAGDGGLDPMSFAYLCSRESYLGNRNWTIANERDDVIMSLPVHPQYDVPVSLFGETLLQPTALSFCAYPFSFWRGDITFRFEVVASSFHRGKLMFIYEPIQNVYSDAKATNFNENSIAILDIETDNDIDVQIGYASRTNFLTCDTSLYIDSSEENEYQNGGVLKVKVLTPLVSPSGVAGGGNTVTINVYMWSDNMEFACPKSEMIVNRTLISESQDNKDALPQGTDGPDTFIDNYKIKMNSGSKPIDDVYLMNFGERIQSFRTLLGRSHLVYQRELTDAYTFITSTRGFSHSTTYPYVGSSAGEPTSTAGVTQSNIFNYLRPAYLGERGGLRFRVVITGEQSTHNYVRCSNDFWAATPGAITFFGVFTNPQTGPAAIHHFMGNGTEFEIPDLSPTNFSLACAYRAGGTSIPSIQQRAGNFVLSGEAIDAGRIYMYCSKAEDFTFMRFQGAPMRIV